MIFGMLAELRRRRDLTTVLVTHNLHFARECGTVLKMEGGTLKAV
jgi:ABC-type methionine transport system ATPase subunit